MELIADILLVCGTFGAMFYCFVLARRLARFNNFENGMGGAVAVLSVQVDSLTEALKTAQQSADASASTLTELNHKAESLASRLEILVASLHDVAEPVATTEPENQPESYRPLSESIFVRHSGARREQAT